MTLSRFFSTLVLAVLITVGCSDPQGPGASIDALPRQLTVAEQKMISGSNAFAFDLLGEINKTQRDSNVFVSPLSASMALGMTANGAAGSTWDAMRTGLRLGDATREEVGEGYKSLIALLRGLDKSTDFRIANSIWYRQGFPFHQSFLTESQSLFDARVQGLDFTSPASLGTINSWVNEATVQKIPTILDKISDDEVMFLINAIYFKGKWRTAFDSRQTTNAPFFASDGTKPNVPLMTQTNTLRISDGTGFTAVDLLYGNSAFAMTIVLPNEGVSVNTVAQSLDDQAWAKLTESFFETRTILHLPRFKLEWKRKLNDDLVALGMGTAFTEGQADFSRMSPDGHNLFITEVVQKTFVDVNEEGTEAAAATSVGVGVTSGPRLVRVDRPFMFVIRERLSGTILFIGKIMKLPA